jgi:hypothetical protein
MSEHQRGQAADPQRGRPGRTAVPGDADERVEIGQQRLGPVQHEPAQWGRHRAGRSALEQLAAENPLDAFELCGQRRLTDAEPGRRPAQAARLGHGADGPQVTQLQLRHNRNLCPAGMSLQPGSSGSYSTRKRTACSGDDPPLSPVVRARLVLERRHA